MDAQMHNSLLTDAVLIERVDEALRRFLLLEAKSPLHNAVEYSVFGGGKRVRPLLCLRACQAVGGEIELALPSACAIELIHTFSLVHDDLPAMDDDDLRRSRPTLHRHTSEAMAILAGDAMTALAFQLISTSGHDSELSVLLTSHLSRATNAMILGQVYDTMGGLSEKIAPIDRLKIIHEHKTGKLIQSAVVMGGESGGASITQLEFLEDYAHAMGLMFQAVDDLLDVTQSAEKMGKATGKDASQGKLTYPGLLGIDGTRAEIDKLLRQALDALSGFDQKADPLREMATKLATREH